MDTKLSAHEVFVVNLRAAAKKAGSPTALMRQINGSMPTYYNWLRASPSKSRSSTLVASLASYVGFTETERIFSEVCSFAHEQKDEDMSDVERMLQVMDSIKTARKRYTWATVQLWVSKVKEWTEMLPNGSIDDLLLLIDKMSPPKSESQVEENSVVEQEVSRTAV